MLNCRKISFATSNESLICRNGDPSLERGAFLKMNTPRYNKRLLGLSVQTPPTRGVDKEGLPFSEIKFQILGIPGKCPADLQGDVPKSTHMTGCAPERAGSWPEGVCMSGTAGRS